MTGVADALLMAAAAAVATGVTEVRGHRRGTRKARGFVAFFVGTSMRAEDLEEQWRDSTDVLRS